MPTKKKIVIAGGGTSGWLAAAAICKLFGMLYDVVLIESDEIGRIGVGEATIPPLRTFHRLIGIDEIEMIRSTQATFKLGIEFSNWARKGDKYFHSFGVAGKDCWACDFHHFWVAGRKKQLAATFAEYSSETVAACSGKMWAYQENGLNFAYHLDAGLYADHLRRHAIKHGVKRIEGKFTSVNIHVEKGTIESLRMEDGTLVEGDLFLDCTGFQARLIEGALNVSYLPYGHYLPCDSAVAVQSENVSDPRPYTQAIAHDFGWQWRIPLQHRTGNGLVFCSRYVSDDEATATLLKSIEGAAITEPRSFKYMTGRRIKAWHKNCVAIGLASGFLEPVESTSIHLAMSTIIRLMKLLPNISDSDYAKNEFNNQFRDEMDRVRNFIVLHYCATERNDSPFWRYCGSMEIPDALRHRIRLFRETGAIPLREKELFQVDSWVQVLFGQRIQPENYHPIVDLMDDKELSSFLNNIHSSVIEKVLKMPSHLQFIDKYCKALPVSA